MGSTPNTYPTSSLLGAELLEQIVGASADGLFSEDLDGRITSWNPGAERIYGRSARDVLGHYTAELLPEITTAQLEGSTTQALDGTHRFETWHQRQDGTRLAVSVTVSPLCDRRGKPVGLVTSVHDVTPRTELATHIEKARRDLQGCDADVARRLSAILDEFAQASAVDPLSADVDGEHSEDPALLLVPERRSGVAVEERIAAMRDQGLSPQSIAARLNRDGLLTARGRRWSAVSVSRCTPPRPADRRRGTHAPPTNHSVLFHHDVSQAVQEVASFVRHGLQDGGHVLLVLTTERRRALMQELTRAVVEPAREAGHLVLVDAERTLDRLMRDGVLDPQAFEEHVLPIVRRHVETAPRVSAYGEMVTLLWERGNLTAALALEQLWNETQQSHPFTLLCSYPLSLVGEPGTGTFLQICERHDGVRVTLESTPVPAVC